MFFFALISPLLLSAVISAQPVLVDHIIAICDYYVISQSDIERAKQLIFAGAPTILDKEDFSADNKEINKAVLKELLIRYLADKKAYQFQTGKPESSKEAKDALDSIKSSLGPKKYADLLKSIAMSEDAVLKELAMWVRAKIFIERQMDMRVQLGKKQFYEKNRALFTGEYYEEEERVIKLYRKKLMDDWLNDELQKANYRILDESFKLFGDDNKPNESKPPKSP